MVSPQIEKAVAEIGRIVLKGVPEDAGFIFYAAEVEKVLVELQDGTIRAFAKVIDELGKSLKELC